MGSRSLQWGLWSNDDKMWYQILGRQYNRQADCRHALPFDRLQSPSPRIPRVVHHIWLGGRLPRKFWDFRESWHRVLGAGHPFDKWTFKMWTDADVESFGMENKAAFDAAPNPGEKSDIWRYEILHRYGGLYVDTDFECVKSLDELHCRFEFYAGISNTGTVELNNGLVGAAPGHTILAELIRSIGAWHEQRVQNVNCNRNGRLTTKSPLALIAEMAGPEQASFACSAASSTLRSIVIASLTSETRVRGIALGLAKRATGRSTKSFARQK